MPQVDASMAEATVKQHTGGSQTKHGARSSCGGECDDNECHCEHEAEFAELDTAPCVHRFGYACRDLLLEHPRLIGKVISCAKKFQSTPGGVRLLDILNSIRRMDIERMPHRVRERTLKRALRRSGATLAPVLDDIVQ